MPIDRLPLAGVRVADISQVWAGPHCTRMLADLGADVVKVESIQRMDMPRGPVDPPRGYGNYPDGEPGEHPYNRAGSFNAVNLNKHGVTLNLRDERGVELFKRLVAISDIVIENFSLGVMERLGIGNEELRAVRPDIIMLSMPAFGLTGPQARYVAYGIGQEQLSGMVSLTGYPDTDMPYKSGINVGDPISALHATSAILSALFYRRRTGRGQFIELAHLETNIALIGEAVLEYTMNRRNPRRVGNRHRWAAPHGCYPSQGEDAWVTIACFSDAEFRALSRVMEAGNLADDPRFATLPTRHANQDELDRIIAAWTRQRTHYAAMHLLQAAGVTAGAVLNTAEVMSDPQIEARGFFEMVTHPEAGTHPYPGIPYKLGNHELGVRQPAPLLGEHNAVVLCDLLGLGAAAYAELERDQVIGNSPLGR